MTTLPLGRQKGSAVLSLMLSRASGVSRAAARHYARRRALRDLRALEDFRLADLGLDRAGLAETAASPETSLGAGLARKRSARARLGR